MMKIVAYLSCSAGRTHFARTNLDVDACEYVVKNVKTISINMIIRQEEREMLESIDNTNIKGSAMLMDNVNIDQTTEAV
jgi:hypothetical protein